MQLPNQLAIASAIPCHTYRDALLKKLSPCYVAKSSCTQRSEHAQTARCYWSRIEVELNSSTCIHFEWCMVDFYCLFFGYISFGQRTHTRQIVQVFEKPPHLTRCRLMLPPNCGSVVLFHECKHIPSLHYDQLPKCCQRPSFSYSFMLVH